MSTAQRRILLGLALLASLAATTWVASQDEPSSGKPRTKAVEGEQAAKSVAILRANPAEPGAAAAEEISLDKLHRAKTEAAAGKLFESDTWAPPPPKVAAKSAPPPVPTPPALPFKYFGKLTDGGRITVFLDAADRSYAVGVGDVIDGRYKVDDIKDERMVLTYLPLQMRQTLQIGD